MISINYEYTTMKMTGVFKEYFPDGSVRKETQMFGGEKHGIRRKFNDKGTLIKEGKRGV